MQDHIEHYRVDLCAPDVDVKLASALTERGIALLDGISDAGSLLHLVRRFAVVVPHHHSAADGVTTLVDRGVTARSGLHGFTARALSPHTDGAGLDDPPAVLLMTCRQPATSGGECLLVDAAALHDDLARNDPDAVRALSAPRCALFGGAAGHLGSVFTTTPDGQVQVRLRMDDLARFAPAAARWLPTLRAAIDRNTITIRLRRGQGYVLHNHRWLHGRRAFAGQRLMYRVHAEPVAHLEIPSGFGVLSRPASPSSAA
ncbi:MAG: TauD/TfdA family dioxygenase [Actinomycetota bacterium]|nr:TauD/TfdA family dioxygenase [Actinomycetota bacterium]